MDIGALTKTVPPSKSIEFTIHVPLEYDYRFHSQRRDQILEILKKLYIISMKKNCPVYTVITKDLKQFTTTENDKKKNILKFPPSSCRNYEEDL